MEGLFNLQNILTKSEIYIWFLNNLIFNLLLSFIDLSLFLLLFQVKCSKEDKIKIVLTSGMLNCICRIFIVSPYVSIINMIITTIIFKVFFKSSIEKCILVEVLNIMTYVCPEIIISRVLGIIFKDVNTYEIGFLNIKYSFLLMLSILIIRLIIITIIKHKKIVLDLKDNLSYENKFNLVSISLIGCILVLLNILELDFHNTNFLYVIFTINIISLVIYFCISIKSIIKIAILEEQYNKIHTLESYNKTLSIMYDNIRGFKHDFSNFVQALDGYVKTNDIDGIRTMSEGILKDCISTNNLEILDPDIINNSAIYSLITNKYYLAQEQDIVMNIEVMIDLKEINISNYDLCRILAILLDNAIEAASKCIENKIINLKLLKDFKANRKLIII